MRASLVFPREKSFCNFRRLIRVNLIFKSETISPYSGVVVSESESETISPHSGVVVSPLAIGGHNVRVMLENIKCCLFILNQNTSFVSQFFRPAALKLSQQHVCKYTLYVIVRLTLKWSKCQTAIGRG